MSQPEMQPGEESLETGGRRTVGGRTAGGNVAGGRTAGPRRGRRATNGRRGDLLGRPFPVGDWAEPAQRLDELYRWTERRALRTVEWYLADRVGKRAAARLLRVGTVLGTATGVALPLLELTGAAGTPAAWGFLALLGAALCLCGDRYFGLTAGWMRDVATAQAVQRRLDALQYEWAAESVREVLGPPESTAGEAAERYLEVLRRFSADVAELVRAETADWMVEFRAGQGPRPAKSPAPASPRAESCPPAPARLALPPVTRPAMPRQRPPEGPR